MEYKSTTTLNRIREGSPASGRACYEGWVTLLKNVGKTSGDDEPIDLVTVLDSNGLNDAIWVLTHAMPDDRLARHFQARCAERYMHLTGDREAVARNAASADSAARAARAAAWNAARAAGSAAGDAALDAELAAQEKQLREMLAQ